MAPAYSIKSIQKRKDLKKHKDQRVGKYKHEKGKGRPYHFDKTSKYEHPGVGGIRLPGSLGQEGRTWKSFGTIWRRPAWNSWPSFLATFGLSSKARGQGSPCEVASISPAGSRFFFKGQFTRAFPWSDYSSCPSLAYFRAQNRTKRNRPHLCRYMSISKSDPEEDGQPCWGGHSWLW